MRNKILYTVMLLLLLLCSCKSTKPGTPGLIVDIGTPATSIKQRSQQQKQHTSTASGIAPDIKPHMKAIDSLADANIKDAEKIVNFEETLAAHDALKDDEILALTEENQKQKEEIKAAHNNVIVWILAIFIAVGLAGVAGGIGLIGFIAWTMRKFSTLGFVIFACGATVAGLGIAALKTLDYIPWFIGGMLLIITAIIAVKWLMMNKATKRAAKAEKINQELCDTWETDRKDAKGKHSLETKLFATERKYEIDQKNKQLAAEVTN